MEDPHTRDCEKDVTLQNATESTRTRTERSAEEEDDRGEVNQEECLKNIEKLHTQNQRSREDEGGSRCEHRREIPSAIESPRS